MLTLVMTLLLSCLAAFILLWGLGYSLQSYLYESIADHLPTRAVIGGILIGCFYTFWVYVNTRQEHKDRYGVLQDFSPTAAVAVEEFTATRVYPNIKLAENKFKEEEVVFKRTKGSKFVTFRDLANQPFRINDSQFVTQSITVKINDQPVKMNAVWESPNVYAKPNGRSSRFVEINGKRFMEADQPSTLYIPSTAVLIGAILLNIMNYLIWIVGFWLCLRFTLGHAVVGAIGFGAIMMIMFVPLLFQQNELKKVDPVVMQMPAADEPGEK